MDEIFSPALILAVLGVLAAGWGVSRSGAVAGWKSVAEARKERIEEIEATQARAEEREAALLLRVAELEQREDLSAVIERLDALREAVDAISDKWG